MASLDLANTRRERVSIDNPEEGDLYVDPNTKDLLLIDEADSEVQAVTVRFRTFKGEWFEDLDAGLPWFQYILANKAVDLTVVRGLFSAEILGRGTFREVTKMDITLPNSSRQSQVTFTAVLTDGTLVGPYTRGLV
jgi:hypothetical protein